MLLSPTITLDHVTKRFEAKRALEQATATIGAWIGGFVKVDDAAYQIIRDPNETAKRLAALK